MSLFSDDAMSSPSCSRLPPPKRFGVQFLTLPALPPKLGGRFGLPFLKAEHSAVLRAVRHLEDEQGAIVRWLPVNQAGRFADGTLSEVVEWADLLCVQSANNEVGTINDINRIEQIAASSGAVLLVDASQSAGYLPLDLNLERSMAVISSHKMYGPRGAAALIGSHVYRSHRRPANLELPEFRGRHCLCRLRLLRDLARLRWLGWACHIDVSAR